MSDIIERLLNRAANAVIIKDKPNLYYDAAHEIERLRAAYEAMDKMLREANQHFMRVDMERNKLRAENETLRRDVKTAVMGDSAELQDVKRENEKLREALKPFADAVTDEYSWKYDINSDDFYAAAAAIRGEK